MKAEGGRMRLLFKQRIFSWFDSYDIFYENGETAFTVKGQIAWGHLLNIYTPSGQKIGQIKERLFTFLPKFELFEGERRIGTISKEFTLFKPRYNIDFNGWAIEGDFMQWNYRAYYKKELIMSAQKKIWNLSDTYEIEVQNPGNALYALMVVLAIDAANCSAGNG